jgi:hypothetical protein
LWVIPALGSNQPRSVHHVLAVVCFDNPVHFVCGEWRDIGEYSRDGVTWTEIIDMRLHGDSHGNKG